MKRIVALTLKEHDRLKYSAYLKSLYREFGMWKTYAFLPAIILPEFDFDSKIDIKNGEFSFSGEIKEVDGMKTLKANETVEGRTPCLFLTKGELPKDLKIEPIYPDLVIPPHYSTTDYDEASPNTVPLSMLTASSDEETEKTDTPMKQVAFDYNLLSGKKNPIGNR